MKSFIKSSAIELGFGLAGITSAAPVDELAHFENAIEKKYIASMLWLARDPNSRCNPKYLLPGAKSVVCCALEFGENGIEENYSSSRKNNFKKARFARGADYHKVIYAKLEKLWQLIKQKAPDAHAKLCVDTGPISEKAFAARAGLGWIGKNTLLVNKKIGSWFVLGEIITDLEIETDRKTENKCGDCRACIDACPTLALKHPFILDSNKCLSYLTTVHKGEIPENMRGFIVNGMYGCDLCQEACPFGKIRTVYNHFDF